MADIPLSVAMSLAREVGFLRGQVKRLEDRIRELESQIEEMGPAPLVEVSPGEWR